MGLAESWARQREHGAGDRGLRRSARGTSARGANHPKTPKQAFIDPEFLRKPQSRWPFVRRGVCLGLLLSWGLENGRGRTAGPCSPEALLSAVSVTRGQPRSENVK